jgi:hypothetical protein
MLRVIWTAVAGCAILLSAALLLRDIAVADKDCDSIQAGPERTNCFILKGRLHGLKSSIAADRARQTGNAAKLSVTKEEGVRPASSEPTTK